MGRVSAHYPMDSDPFMDLSSTLHLDIADSPDTEPWLVDPSQADLSLHSPPVNHPPLATTPLPPSISYFVDPFHQWVRYEGQCDVTDLYAHYQQCCHRQSLSPVTYRVFLKDLKESGWSVTRKNGPNRSKQKVIDGLSIS